MRPRRAERHEEAAVDVRQVHRVGAGLVAGLVCIVAVAWLLWRFWLMPPTPAAIPRTKIPLAPLLQPHPAGDLAAQRARQHARLHGYAWVDRRAGITRIPIQRAMALLIASDARQPAPSRSAEAGP